MSWNVWNRPSGSFMVDMGISSIIMSFWDMTIYNDTLNWSDITPICQLITQLDLLPILTLLPNFGGFYRTLQRVRLANRERLLLRTPGPVIFGTCICSNVETILSWTCHVYGPWPSVLLFCVNVFSWKLKKNKNKNGIYKLRKWLCC